MCATFALPEATQTQVADRIDLMKTFEAVLDVDTRYENWQMLEKMCHQDVDAVVKQLIDKQLYDLARKVNSILTL